LAGFFAALAALAFSAFAFFFGFSIARLVPAAGRVFFFFSGSKNDDIYK
jgi:hypothetical protein